MIWYIAKLAITAALIVTISEVSKMSSFVGALLASVPLVSVLAMCWMYVETKDVEQISLLTTSIFWLVLPSLSFFVIFPVLLKAQIPFTISMLVSLTVMIGCYFATVFLLDKFGTSL